MVRPVSAGKGDRPRPQTPAGRQAYEETLRRVYGVRVKIPPPGPEYEELVYHLRSTIANQRGGLGSPPSEIDVRAILGVLADKG
jgi:hypothetical protein